MTKDSKIRIDEISNRKENMTKNVCGYSVVLRFSKDEDNTIFSLVRELMLKSYADNLFARNI